MVCAETKPADDVSQYSISCKEMCAVPHILANHDLSVNIMGKASVYVNSLEIMSFLYSMFYREIEDPYSVSTPYSS